MSSILKVDNIQDSGGNSYLSSDGSGTFTTSGLGLVNTPMFLAGGDTEISVSNSTFTLLTMGEVIDTNDAYDPSTGKFTIPSGHAGKYFFTFTGTHRATSNDQTAGGFSFYKNGSSSPYNWSQSNFTGHRNDTRSYSYVFDLSVGDYIQGYAFTGGNGTKMERPTMMGYKLIGA